MSSRSRLSSPFAIRPLPAPGGFAGLSGTCGLEHSTGLLAPHDDHAIVGNHDVARPNRGAGTDDGCLNVARVVLHGAVGDEAGREEFAEVAVIAGGGRGHVEDVARPSLLD